MVAGARGNANAPGLRTVRGGAKKGVVELRVNMSPKLPPADADVAEIAARQYGKVNHAQLAALGLDDEAIKYRIRVGRLHIVHRGVYAVGYERQDVRGEWMAAVLAGGDGALLSHASAARLWGIAGGRRQEGLRFHHPRRIHADDRDIRDRIPVTSVPRTLLDLAASLDQKRLAKAFEEAERQRLLDHALLASLLKRSQSQRGLNRLRALANQAWTPPEDARQGMEVEFAGFCRACGLPMPSFNVLVGGYLVDALWPRERLIAELDSRAWHSTWQARERDSVRDADLQVLGYRVVRVTWRRLTAEANQLEATIRALLATPEPPRARRRAAA